MAIYVASDIHGLKDRFDKMLESLVLRKDDHLYILGDVVDRGPDGIEILLACMKHPQITLLMGNHEYMMMQVLDAIEPLSKHQRMYEAVTYFERWFRNGCQPTLTAYETLTKKQQKELHAYLHRLPLAICDVKIHGRKYYLVHASPVCTYRKGVITLDDIVDTAANVNQFVWDRITDHQSFFKDRCVIFGHTMTSYYQESHPYAIWSKQTDLLKSNLIGINCGCASNDEHTRLACLCLDDMQVRYF